MKKITVYQVFTGNAWLGATFFIISAMIFWGAYIAAIPAISTLVMSISLLIFLCSVVLMFAGRRFEVIIDQEGPTNDAV